MSERRNSDRQPVTKVMVKEENGDYFFTYRAKDLSEEGVFLETRQCVGSQEPFSRLSFVLPNGKSLRNITARIVREQRKGEPKGCGYEFMNMNEEQRMELKRFLAS